MKKLSLLVIALMASASSFAQTSTPVTTTTTPNPAIQAQMKDLRHDERAYNKEKAQVKQDISKGDLTAAKAGIAVLKTDKSEIGADAKALKAEGVKTPVQTAAKQIRKTDETTISKEIKTIKADKAIEKTDIKNGDQAAAKTELAAIKAARKDLRKDIRAARRDGIRHPLHRK